MQDLYAEQTTLGLDETGLTVGTNPATDLAAPIQEVSCVASRLPHGGFTHPVHWLGSNKPNEHYCAPPLNMQASLPAVFLGVLCPALSLACPAATIRDFGCSPAVSDFCFVCVQECRRVCQTGNEMLRHFWASFPWTSKQREEKAAKLDRALASHYDRSAML